jgi:EAL domain-containing protein (putative c-di-GMP-specific phosphodiesterase class I)
VHEACRQGRLWIHEGLSRLPVAVNISATQFHSESFVQDISAILRDTGLPPRWLELELTETTLMRDVQAATDALNLLRSMGIRIAIDDFGTGYCGLAYLKRLPVDTLKIDQSFVHDVPEKRNDAEIISAIVRLGRTLEREIIAEGVETSAQLEFLRALHCDAVQGFLISGPLPATDLARFVRSHPAGH